MDISRLVFGKLCHVTYFKNHIFTETIMKKILITGGCSGLGWEMSQLALRKWYEVDILDISLWDKKLSDFPAKLQYLEGDISQISADFVETLSQYDVVICNAGISLSGDYIEHSAEQNLKLMQINALGHMELIRLLLIHQKIKDSGNIGCIVSASQMLPFPIALWYAASKWALDSFAWALSSYLTWRKISVSRVYPGPMPTAHVKYYGQEQKRDQKSRRKVQKIAEKSLMWILKRKKKIYPDSASKLIKIVSPFEWILAKLMYQTYKQNFHR